MTVQKQENLLIRIQRYEVTLFEEKKQYLREYLMEQILSHCYWVLKILNKRSVLLLQRHVISMFYVFLKIIKCFRHSFRLGSICIYFENNSLGRDGQRQ